jgi:Fe-Mn family superoxide dismutase
MFKIEALPYEYNALEPFIDEETMRLHHDKHHQTYCDKFNVALEKYPEYYEKDAESLIADINNLPEDIRLEVRNHGGGYVNHNFFWKSLSPAAQSGTPEGDLLDAINSTFGNLDNFKSAFKNKALALFGSGWTWLVKDEEGKLEIVNLPNQDSPLSNNKKPILALDVWEHAYYLKYQNRRAEYVDAWFNLINWSRASELYR